MTLRRLRKINGCLNHAPGGFLVISGRLCCKVAGAGAPPVFVMKEMHTFYPIIAGARPRAGRMIHRFPPPPPAGGCN